MYNNFNPQGKGLRYQFWYQFFVFFTPMQT